MATIKAGTYRFNDVVDTETYNGEVVIPFTLPSVVIDGVTNTAIGEGLSVEPEIISYNITYSQSVNPWGNTLNVYDSSSNGWCYKISEYKPSGWGQTFTVTADTEVDDTFATWFNANAVLQADVEYIPVTAEGLLLKLQTLTDNINAITKKKDAYLSTAIQSLADGFGVGGEDWDGGYTLEGEEIVTTVLKYQDKTLALTANATGTLLPDSGYDALSSVAYDINVQPKLQSKQTSVTTNGSVTLTPDKGYDGLSSAKVVVNVPTTTVTTETATVTASEETQTITPASADYFDKVIVNPIPDGYIIPANTLNITVNDKYDVTNYAEVNVQVSEPEGAAEITENGTFDVAEYASVTVNVARAMNFPDIKMVMKESIDFSQLLTSILGNVHCTYHDYPAFPDDTSTYIGLRISDGKIEARSHDAPGTYITTYDTNGWASPYYRILHLGAAAYSTEFLDFIRLNVDGAAIEFTINNVTYYAVHGTTWSEWITQSYAATDLEVIGNNIHIINAPSDYVVKLNGTAILATDTIISGASYTI